MRKNVLAALVSALLVAPSIAHGSVAGRGMLDASQPNVDVLGPQARDLLASMDPGAMVSAVVTLREQADLSTIAPPTRAGRVRKVVAELRATADWACASRTVRYWVRTDVSSTVAAPAMSWSVARRAAAASPRLAKVAPRRSYESWRPVLNWVEPGTANCAPWK